MEGLMIEGNCRLCGQKRELTDSHVWPKFAYKYFAANQSKGGSFIDVFKQREHNGQCTRPWFCKNCDNQTLSAVERYAAIFCKTLDRRPTESLRYDERLLRFCASISLRTAMNSLEHDTTKRDQTVRPACRQWRDYLRGKRSSVGIYSQHVFVVFGRELEFHKGLGGNVFLHQDVVLSQIGPLFIVGQLRQERLSLPDLKIWNESQVFESGGVVSPISAWRVGTNITRRFAKLLAKHERTIITQLIDLMEKGKV